MTTSNRLVQQCWRDWLSMAEGTLAGVSQMVWQNEDVVDENRKLLAKVTGVQQMAEHEWRNAITWAGATMLSLSAEQCMKALAIRAGANGEYRKTHDLRLLWDDLGPDDKTGIERAARQLRDRTMGTRLADGPPLAGIEQIERIIDSP